MTRAGKLGGSTEQHLLGHSVHDPLALLRECLRATKLEQNDVAYISDFQCRVYEASY